ncbi:uncharacterized protein BT62DRAFT_1078609 [Guyanagaster necrorhizus]|uniref:F-box domain-containing protein n=1 Tax=Guyanagaster necrorhizus TaxID=856835 RepID=A0A9P7VMH2_9AGAR|nr:uncharacterized protein BT62DRAFT_1078609 [Guyanagaster necrorhizus MCA 3950]KAG7443230.1 hypothetical protein BT62DRAFT_1078609 [Guyanagaster necrorhizus MCA 3950]
MYSKDGGEGESICGEKYFAHIFLCIIWLLPLALIAFLFVGTLLQGFFQCFTELYKNAVTYYTACRQENIPSFIEFYAYAWIFHPIRRIRISCRILTSKFRNHTMLNIPRDFTLPQELCEIIINFCYPDRATLLTCSLVCKAWIPASRRLLSIRVHSRDRVRELVKLLNSPDNTISPYVQTVSLWMHTKHDGLVRYRHALRSLANADSRISRAKISGQSSDPAIALHRYFPHIRRLSFNYEDQGETEGTSATNIRHILLYSSLFCDLKRLSIQFVRRGNDTEDVPLPSLEAMTLPASLRSLSLKFWNKDLLRWLNRHHATLRLTTFKLKIGGHWLALDPSPVNSLLRPCRTSLRFITLTMIQWENGFLDLRFLTELRAVVLHVYHLPSTKATLSSLNSSHIETVTIIISGDSLGIFTASAQLFSFKAAPELSDNADFATRHLITFTATPGILMPLSSRDGGYDGDICGVKKGWHLLACMLWLLPLTVTGLLTGIFIAYVLFSLLCVFYTEVCTPLYKKAVASYCKMQNSYTAYRQENIPTFIEFYAYAWIFHPIRRIRISWRILASKFRNHAMQNVPRDFTLPQELFEIILTFCSLDRATLLTCSLVCKAWIPTSRRLLSIRVHSRDRVRELVKLLNSPDNTISPYVQTVSLWMHTKHDGLVRYRHALCALVNAGSRIYRAKIAGRSADPAIALRRYFPHLRRLSFSYEGPGNIAETSTTVRRILLYSSLFPDLQRLSIQFTNVRNGIEDVPLSSLEDITLPASLRSLSLKSWNYDLLRWLKRHHATLRLRTFKLKLRGFYWQALDPRPIIYLLRSSRSSLWFVTLRIIQWKNGFLDLSFLTELRAVALYVNHIPSAKATLSTLNSSHIETVSITSRHWGNNSLDDFMAGISFRFFYRKSTWRHYIRSTASGSRDIT